MMNKLLLIVMILLVGCEQKKDVYYPIINIYVPEQKKDRKIVDLPVCYLETCDDIDNDQCSKKALSEVQKVNSEVWELFESKNSSIFSSGKNIFYLQLVRTSDLSPIINKWSEIGCIPKDDSARQRECIRYMPEWVSIANSTGKGILDLIKNPDYRRTCLRIAE